MEFGFEPASVMEFGS